MADNTTHNGAAPSTSPTVDVAALIRASKRTTKTVQICLRADLVAQVEHLDRELAAHLDAAKAGRPQVNDPRMSDTTPDLDPVAVAMAERIDELRAEMRSSTVDFVMQALAPRRWKQLCDEHKPRKDPDDPKRLHPDDAAIGVDVTTFWEPLVKECLASPREVLEPATWELLMGRAQPTPEDPEAHLRGLTDAQWDSLAGAAWQVNKGKVDIPFSWAASRVSRS